MDQAALVTPDLAAGKRLVDSLDQNAFPVTSAFWLFQPEASAWRLFIASPLVDTLGPRGAYAQLEKRQGGETGSLPLRDISLVSPNDALVRLLAGTFETGADNPGFWVTGLTIDGHHIDSAYIYRAGAIPRLPGYKGFTITAETESDASLRAGIAWVNVDQGKDEVFRVKVIAPYRSFRRGNSPVEHEARCRSVIGRSRFARAVASGSRRPPVC